MIFWIVVIIASICAAVWFTYVGMKRFAEETDHAYERDNSYRFFPYNTPRDIIQKHEEELEQNKARYNQIRESKRYCRSKWWSQRESGCIIFGGIAIVLSVIIAIMLFAIGMVHAFAPAEQIKLITERDTLVYELEHNIYTDNGDDVVGKKELYNQIREFNANLAHNKALQNNFWIGFFVPDIYDEIELIKLP
jgi:cytochrome c-type biogenesis protein CcmH/NrfG